MTIAICDDDIIFLQLLSEKIKNHFQNPALSIHSFSSGEDLITHIEVQQYDLLFLDIEMDGMDGLQTAKQIHNLFSNLPIIFLTSHAEFALEGYEVQAFRFLTKPINSEKLTKALQDFEKTIRDSYKITIVDNGEEKYIFCRDIHYIKSENVYLQVVTSKESYLIRKKLKEQLSELPKDMFLSIHRSYIVNLQYVVGFDGSKVTLSGGLHIPVSRGKRELFKKRMMQYMKGSF